MSANIPEIIKHLKVKRRDELKARKIAERRNKIRIRLRAKKLATELEETLRRDFTESVYTIVDEDTRISRMLSRFR